MSSVLEVYQALTLAGTDSDATPDGFTDPVQVKVMSRPVVVFGALPEALIDAVIAPHEIQSFGFYKEKEANVAVLCKISMSGRTTPSTFVVEIDVSELTVHEQVDLSARQIVQVLVQSAEKTLRSYYGDQGGKAPKCRIKVVGTDEKNAFLLELEKTIKW